MGAPTLADMTTAPATPGALPFRIEFSRRAIEDLHRRIDAARWPDRRFDAAWDAGTSDAVLRDLVHYWRREFDWFEWQERLNRLPHIRAPLVDLEETHAVVLAGPGSDRVPVLLLHGWPGSFIELLPAAERLATDEDGAGIDVVIPSLPGFGFSDAPLAPGMHPGRIAERMHDLMRLLGYERYVVQGGDWGAIVGARLARAHPEAVIGLHLNFPALVPDEAETEEEREARDRSARWRGQESAYGQLQGTKPQTLAYGLTDSPIGQLAWILEKFWAWSDHGDDLWDTFDRDQLLANVTLYWLTGTALSSARTYLEARRERPVFRPTDRCEAPTAFTRYPAEPWFTPRSAFERAYRLVRWTEAPRGGHFAAMEQPAWFARDVASFARQVARPSAVEPPAP